ncbi:MAG: methyl-accepting chemotaxis protein, partial [Bacteroidales bacterium]|nr:methyl-accepting chemotaxis protein [Bacteroidales bacterium]
VYEAFINSEEGQQIAALGERAECWIDSHKGLDEETGESTESYALSYVKAMMNSGGKISGYIIIDVKRTFIEGVLAKAKSCLGSQEVFMLSNGTQIEANAGKVTLAEQSFYQKALEQEEVQGFSYEKVAGKELLFSYQKVGRGMVVCSLVPKDEIMASVRMVMIVTIFAILLCTVVSVIVGTTIAKNISKALYSVNGVLKKTSEGDLTGRVAVKRKDEFAILGANLAETIKGMKSLIMKMTHVSQDVSGSAEAVNSNSEVLLNVTEHISHAVGDINQGIVQQAEDTQSCVLQMSELADKITQVHERTDRMSSLTSETKNAVEEGVHSVRELENKVEDSTLCTREIVQEIEALHKASEDISSIVVTMNSIAEETNLLSLNASIEAARAGEAGKGFAVVSEEIRKLAEQSTQAGGRIGEIIMEVQSRVSSTMETAVKADSIVEAQTQALNNTISIFEEISKRVTEMEHGVEHILDSVDRIEAAKTDTLSAIESISATAHETEAASSELGDGSSQLLDTVNQLNEAVQMLRENAIDLNSSVKIFKI